jgi:RNA polymerase sigma-54 factor
MLEMDMSPQMEMQVNPALLNLAHMLALPGVALYQIVQQELAENPSLEEVDVDEGTCAICGGLLIEGVCIQCMSQRPEGNRLLERLSDNQADLLLFVAAPHSMTEGLLIDLYASLPEADHSIADALVGSLDDQGFLVDDPADLAKTLSIDPERVTHVLHTLREIGPPGIATRDTRACLLAQIAALEEQGTDCSHAAAVVEHHLEDLGEHRYKQIAHHLQISIEEVQTAHEFIQHNLFPYPSQVALHEPGLMPDRTRYRTPDMVISEKEGSFIVEVIGSPRRYLRMNPLYQELVHNTSELDEDERTHVQEYVARTRVFLANLRQRESTLKRIGDSIIARQQEFLREGVRHLAPMTRADLATELGLHESTISRAVAEKTALLPDKTLLPLSEFFVAARSVQDVLRELIETEQTPLSDHELARMLTERGYPVARRTVAKYRTQMKILPSYLRRPPTAHIP